MHFDPVRSAYIDNESGEIVYIVEGEEAIAAAASASPSNPRIPTTTPRKKKTTSSNSSYGASSPYYAGVVATPASQTFDFEASPASAVSELEPRDEENRKKKKDKHHHHRHREDVEKSGETRAEKFERLFEMKVAKNLKKQREQELADELYSIQLATNASDVVVNPSDIDLACPDENPVAVAAAASQPSYWDDWNFARTLQALEFEIGNDEMMMQEDGYDENGEPITDFERKEYHASRSCRRQLLTISFFICMVQIALLVAMIQVGGYAPRSENSVIGPPVYIMVRFGAKQTALMVDENEWFRLVAPIMLHAGIFHLIPNVAIQLRVGGYLNLVYGTPKWLWIYFISGIYGVIASCLFLPDAVGVGSSGALMGMLSSWVVWIIFRWQKIPRRCHSQRNCQLGVVTLSIVVTLATSTMPNVDWSAHLGGSVMGVLFGIIFLTNELDNTFNQRLLRVAATIIAGVIFGVSLWYLLVKLKYSDSSLAYWEANDDWA
jgi:membrane associated rhomboid family serine protease